MSPSSLPDAAAAARVARDIRKTIAGSSSERDRSARLPLDEIELIRASGLGALRIPRAYGGAALGFESLADAIVQIAAGDPSVAQSLQPHFIFLERVNLMGSEAQRQRYLRAASDGALFGNAMSEVGVAPGAWTTRLQRCGGGWRLNGRKFYATGTTLADLTFVGALDDQGDRVLAIVPVTRRGVRIDDDWRAMGQRATASGSVHFDAVDVADDEVIPLAPWEARRHHTGAGSQIIHCAIDAGIAAAALDDAVGFARTRARAARDSGAISVLDDPLAHHTVGEIAALAFAAESAVLQAARRLDLAALALYAVRDDALTTPEVDALLVEASIAVASAKIVSSNAALRAAEKLFEVGGASGAASALNLDRHWRNARTHTLHDPLPHKYRVIGEHLLTGAAPPNSFTY
jgi:alkylation response protein AidB-like acyl-CoA dehydrogenase